MQVRFLIVFTAGLVPQKHLPFVIDFKNLRVRQLHHACLAVFERRGHIEAARDFGDYLHLTFFVFFASHPAPFAVLPYAYPAVFFL